MPWTLGATGLTYLLTRNVTKAMSILMVDFCCALKLAMPISVLSAIREASLYNVTVKGGKFLEVKIAPNAKPPVCKVIDYGKYRYEQARKEKDAKKKQKTVELKEIRLSPNIEANDLNTKMNAAKKFLAKGNKVKITLRFRGREMAHMNASKHILDDIAENLSDVAVVEKAPKVEGRSIGMVLAEKR